MNEATKYTIAKELTQKAIEANLIRLKAEEAQDSEAVGKAIAALYNAIVKEIQY